MNMKTAARTTSSETTKSRFVLTRKNQKGQVAIFVALIFQVIFIFFALLINVGLLVHHKINLQQSTDLAAYYGAMKQAEVMNTIAHVNFQIKQAWKLLTWRYRILGTFGLAPGGGGPTQKFPFQSISTGTGTWQFEYNGRDLTNTRCTGSPDFLVDGEYVGMQDIPFFCIGHAGFDNWIARTESTCNLDCANLRQPRRINRIPVPSGSPLSGDGGVGLAVQAALNQANNNIQTQCEALSTLGASQLAVFLSSYILEIQQRTKTVEMLAKDLSLSPEEMLDIEGKKIIDGTLRTFKNNLTEANLRGFEEDADFLSATGFHNNQCTFQDGRQGGVEWLKRIEYNFINYFVHNCIYTPGGPNNGANYRPENVYDDSTPSGLGSAFSSLPANIRDTVLSLLVPGQGHVVGYEKNPHCVEYYAVRASAEPNIPFLPLKKIKLNAVAFAKPFGGTIGPWYGKRWSRGSPRSFAIEMDQSSKVDETLPVRDVAAAAGMTDIASSVFTQPNFSLFVGDKKGLRNVEYVAAYHSALAARDIENVAGKSYSSFVNSNGKLENRPGGWPSLSSSTAPDDWENIGDVTSPDMRNYDSLARNANETGTRVLEISAVAPNQFDLTHYSIDPDFYNNYYRKLYAGFDDLRGATGMDSSFTKDKLRADFGAIGMDADDLSPTDPLDVKTFSVKDQILMKNIAFDTVPDVPRNNPGQKYREIHNYLISIQSSLLTGWTFLNFADYATFPGGEVNATDKTMSFGQCFDAWNKTADAEGDEDDPQHFRTPMNINDENPPAAGNCVTGGRTGYSVKLISPVIVRDPSLLENPIDDAFFNF